MKNGLYIHTANQLELLSKKLAQIIKTPFGNDKAAALSPETIVLQSKGMETWVSMELASLNGICANCNFFFPDAFFKDIFTRTVMALPDINGFEPDYLTFKVMKQLPLFLDQIEFKAIKEYLKDDFNQLKLFQLSEKIADTYDQYLIFRSRMIFNWENSNNNEIQSDNRLANNWQAILWEKLKSEIPDIHRAELKKQLLACIKDKKVDLTQMPCRVSLFGISYLPEFYIEIFAALSEIIPVHFFLVNPCQEYWADIFSSHEIKNIKKKYKNHQYTRDELHLTSGNPLLSSWGKQGRDFFSLINTLDAIIDDDFRPPATTGLLRQIQSDILNMVERRSSQQYFDTLDTTPPVFKDETIQFHSCHSPMREIEVLYDNLLAMFEQDTDLLPKDIIIMTPDIETYAPFIQAVFDQPQDDSTKIPYSIADPGLKKESQIIDAFLALLAIPGSRYEASKIISLLEYPVIREKFDLNEADLTLVSIWIKETNICWGMDGNQRRKLDLPDIQQNTWQAGMDRLLLGYAMPGYDRQLFEGILPYDNIEGTQTKILGRFINFLKTLFQLTEWAEQKQTFAGWLERAKNILNKMILKNSFTEGEFLSVNRCIDDLVYQVESAGLDNPVSFDMVKTCLTKRLEKGKNNFGFITGGLTFCALLPARSIPAKVICLVGMNTDIFPGNDRPVSFDLITSSPRPGDRSQRNDDKYMFLEAILAARKFLYISYVGRNIQDNSPISPSVVVSELLDYLEECFAATRKQLITCHKLQAFSGEYFNPKGDLFTYSKENLTAFKNLTGNKKRDQFVLSRLADPSIEYKTLSVETLYRFYHNPARFFMEKRLGIQFQGKYDMPQDSENFILDSLQQYQIGEDYLHDGLTDYSFDNFTRIQQAKGNLPYGPVGTLSLNKIQQSALVLINQIKPLINGENSKSIKYDIQIDKFQLTGSFKNYYSSGLIFGLIFFRFAKINPKDFLKAFISHLLLHLIEDESGVPARSILIGKDAIFELKKIPDAETVLTKFLNLYWDGLSEPLPFFPKSSHAFAKKLIIDNKSSEQALSDANKTWIGNDFIAGEGEDTYNKICFKNKNPFDEIFQKVSLQIFEPIFSCFQKTS